MGSLDTTGMWKDPAVTYFKIPSRLYCNARSNKHQIADSDLTKICSEVSETKVSSNKPTRLTVIMLSFFYTSARMPNKSRNKKGKSFPCPSREVEVEVQL